MSFSVLQTFFWMSRLDVESYRLHTLGDKVVSFDCVGFRSEHQAFF